jgi:hypothetical protein
MPTVRRSYFDTSGAFDVKLKVIPNEHFRHLFLDIFRYLKLIKVNEQKISQLESWARPERSDKDSSNLLENHPQFAVTALAASDRSAGKPYSPKPAPGNLAGSECPNTVKDRSSCSRLSRRSTAISFFRVCRPAVARETEAGVCARRLSRLSAIRPSYRMDVDVPLLIPEINRRASWLWLKSKNKNAVWA